jgi:hypothetical protein
MPAIASGRIQSGSGALVFTATSLSATTGAASAASSSSGTTPNTTLTLVAPSGGVTLYDSVTQSTVGNNNVTLNLRNLIGTGNITISESDGLIYIFGASNTSPTTAIVAAATGTPTPLTAQLNIVTTVGSSAGVILPATIGVITEVLNRGANTLAVYPPVGAHIEGNGTNAAVTIAVNGAAQFLMTSTTQGYAF